MKHIKRNLNGIIMIIIATVHTHLVISSGGCGIQFNTFAKSNFYKVSKGMGDLPAVPGSTNFEAFAAFWFFYFGIVLFPLAFLILSYEKDRGRLPHLFTISYLIIMAIGSYMIPDSGMTFIMLPHAIFMLVRNYIIAHKNKNVLKV